MCVLNTVVVSSLYGLINSSSFLICVCGSAWGLLQCAVCKCHSMSVGVRGQPLVLVPSFYFGTGGLLHLWVRRLAGGWARGDSPVSAFHFPVGELVLHVHARLSLHGFWEFELGSSLFPGKVLYPWRHLSASIKFIWILTNSLRDIWFLWSFCKWETRDPWRD